MAAHREYQAMKRPPSIALKIGAVVSSLALAAVYVSCRTAPPHADSKTEQTPVTTEPQVFSGSKSGAVFRAPPPPPAQQSQTVMSGSKSLAPVIREPRPAQPPHR